MSENKSSASSSSVQSSAGHVLHIAESFGGGVAAAIHDYRRNAPAFTHHLLYSRRADAPLTSSALDGFATAEELPSGHTARVRTVRRISQRFDQAVLHAHSSFAGFYTRLALKSSQAKPIVYTPHCFAFERRDVPWPARAAFQLAEVLLAYNTDVFAACSQRELALARALSAKATSVFVPNVPPHDVLALHGAEPDEASKKPDRLTLAGSGRFGAQKDPRYFVSAVRALRESGLDVDAVWIGGGDDALLLDAMADAGIRVTGWLPREDGLLAMTQADVYLHTARWEGFPVGVLEVSALGIPAVVRRIPAFTGVHMPMQVTDPSELKRFWAELQTADGRAAVVRAQRMALAECSDDHQARSLDRVYRSALQLQQRS